MTGPTKSRQDLIQEAQGLVYSLATRIHRSLPVRVELDDLVSYGEVGLVEAARDFDPAQGCRFTTFAYYRIRGAIYDGVSKMCWTSRARLRRLRYQRLADEVLAAEGEPDVPPGASLEDEAAWVRNMTDKLAVVFLTSQGEDDRGIHDSSLADPRESAPAIVARHEISQKLRELIGALPPSERRLIQMVYFEGATLQEAADRMGISKSWASRLHARILEQLGRCLRRLGASD